jgi:SNF2 family DNA or RNA helicase
MKIHYNGEIFWAESVYAEKGMLGKDGAGFIWHRNGCEWNCAACKANIGQVWWTKHFDRAMKLIDYADDNAKAALENHAKIIESSRAADVKDKEEFARRVPAPDGIDYFPFQKAGILYALDRKNTLISDDPGLGKTIQALGFINANNFKRALVICPASLRINWSREASRWLVSPWEIKIIHKQKDVAEVNFGIENRLLVIINYDKIGSIEGQDTLTKLMATDWDVLIVDESHYLKNQKTKRATAVCGSYDKKGQVIEYGLTHKANHILFLTGTPLPNRPKELWTTVQTLDPNGLGSSFMRFALRYCAAQKGKWGWDFDGASNLAELQDKLRCFMVRRSKQDVLKELPPKRRQIIELPQNGAEAVIKKQAEAFVKHEDAIKTLEESMEIAEAINATEEFEEAARNLGAARKMAFDEMSKERHQVAVAKIPSVIEHLENILDSTTSKVVLFAWHHDVINGISQALESKGVTHVIITGETSMDKRQEAVDRFQTDPSVKVFLGNIQSAGTGITLTAADIALFAEIDWVPANCLQCEDRLHRIGTVNPVLIQYLVFTNSIDSKMVNMVVDKMKVIEAALDSQGDMEKIEYQLTPERKGRVNKYPVATVEQRKAAVDILIILTNQCDGAVAKDGMGFNRLDARIGRELAIRATQRELTDGEVYATQKIVEKYKNQYSEELFGALFAVATGVAVT